MTDPRNDAHHLIDRLSQAQLLALVGLLETMVDPVDDEPETEEEARAVAASKEWFKTNPGIPFEEVVAGLGFTMEQIRGDKDAA